MSALPATTTSQEASPPPALSRIQKAAVIMMLFGENAASSVLKMLEPDEVKDLGTAMYSLNGVSHEMVDGVLDEFFGILREQTGVGVGANAYVRTVLNDALGNVVVLLNFNVLCSFGLSK